MAPMDSVVEYGWRRAAVVAGVMLATVLQVLDATIVNVALPTIQGNLGASLDDGTWIITGYIIAAVIVIPLTPWLQTRFGRKRYYLAAIAGFTLTSALCGLSTGLGELVVFRILQGLCGGGLAATGQAILRDTFPPRQLGLSQVLVATGAITGPSIGPTLGGILTDAWSWNWIFYINVVPGVLAVVLLLLYLRDPAAPRRARIDVPGLALLAIGLGCLQYALNEGERNDWFADARLVTCAVLACGGLAAFVWWELRTAQPIVDLRILKNRTVAAGTLLAGVTGFTLFGGIVLAPQFTQGVLGFTATLSGESVLVRALGILLFTPLTLAFLNRMKWNARWLLGAGYALVAAANLWQAEVTASSGEFATYVLPLFVGGIGFAQLFTPLAVTVLGAVRGVDTPKAAALLALAQQLGGSIATAVLVTLLDRRGAFHHDALAAGITLSRAAIANVVQHVSPQALAGLVTREASALSFADAFYLLALCGALAVPLVLILRTKPVLASP